VDGEDVANVHLEDALLGRPLLEQLGPHKLVRRAIEHLDGQRQHTSNEGEDARARNLELFAVGLQCNVCFMPTRLSLCCCYNDKVDVSGQRQRHQ